jgi:hypothetical protein
MLPQWTYLEILDRLEALLKYLTDLKVQRVPNRLLGAIANIRELEETQREQRTETLVALDDPASAGRRMQELVWSVVESWQLAIIFEGIRDYDPKVIKKQLLKALKGPLNSIDETGSSNEGRNTLFELF